MAKGFEKSSNRRDEGYAAFDAQLTHQALNVHMFLRLLQWAKPYRITLLLSVVLILATAGLATLQPYFLYRVVFDQVLHSPSHSADWNFGLVGFTQWIASYTNGSLLLASLLIYITFILLQSLTSLGQTLTLTNGSLKTLRDLRVDLFAALERKPAVFYDRVAVGRVMTRVTSDIENLYSLVTSFIQYIAEFVQFFVIVFFMLSISGELTLVGLMVIPIAAAATYFFRKAMRTIFRKIRDSVSALNQYMQEDLMGIEVVQLSSRQDRNIDEYNHLNRENRKQEFNAINHEVVFETLNTSLPSIATAGVIWWGGGLAVQESISIGTLMLFTDYLNRLISPISSLGQLFNTLFRSMASGERIFQALDWQEQLHEPQNPVKLPQRLAGAVRFESLDFSYDKGEQVLHGVSLNIEPGEKLAIVGPTGSGKSTIIRLLCRFYDIPDGKVFIDDIDINSISSTDLRRRIGVVLQDFHLFSGTVLDNITLNNPDISEDRARWAARVVNADSFISDLPDGYQTQLAERGHNLSQGQQQLLAFARVLAANPEVLVLDEATSSIDTGTELIIQDGLRNLMEKRTSIIIAHRLQTIQECDRILVLHHGRVVELGTHEELLRQQGVYYTLHELQFQDVAKLETFDESSLREEIDEPNQWESIDQKSSSVDDPIDRRWSS